MVATAPLPEGGRQLWSSSPDWGSASREGLAVVSSGHLLGDRLALWHDFPAEQIRMRRTVGDCIIDLGDAPGSYLSLSIDLPGSGDVGSDEVLGFSAILGAARPVAAYARLNLVQGPERPVALRRLGEAVVGSGCQRLKEFDLAYLGLARRAVERLWLDLIFEAPASNCLTISQLLIYRRRRAQF